MVDSDKSDNGENQTAKRLREDNSEDEKCELPNKKLRSKSPEHIESVDNRKDPIVQVTNGDAIASKDKNDSVIVKEEHIIVDKDHENGNATDHDNEEMGELSEKKNAAESKDVKLELHVKEEEAELNEREKEKEKEKGKGKGKSDVKEEGTEDEVDNEESVADKSHDSEVVDGLELSVECASDKEASSSESDKEKETKPRPKTIIVKAKPNDSELEVGSSEAEQSGTDNKVEDGNNGKDKKKKIEKRKSTGKESSLQSGASSGSNSRDEDDKVQGDNDGKDKKKKIEKKRKSTGKESSLQSGASSESNSGDKDDEVEDDNDSKDKKKKMVKRKSIGEESSSQSGASSESNSGDEDYSPRTKKKLKKAASPLKKSIPHKAKAKKKGETAKKPVADSENGQSGSDDEEMTLADRAKKISVKSPVKKTEESESNSESEDKADSSSESDAKNKKNGKRSRGDSDPKNDKKIQALRRYLSVAGIRVRFDDLWSGCKNNRQRIDRMKELLAKSGIEGRPTIEKCKKLKKKNETRKEVSELDTSNILSEGRVTRARRIEANKIANITSPSTRREARNLFKRIQPVCDSDTE